MMSSQSLSRASTPARLIIADDHELTRTGLRGMLADESGLEIIGEAANGREALELCQRVQPDLALIDMRMPEMDGMAVTRAIKQTIPRTSVIIVTFYDTPDYILEALKSGAAGFVLKNATRRELIQAIWQVLRGESFLNGELTARLLQRLSATAPAQTNQPIERLTPREQEVLHLLARGMTNRAIAQELVISVGTVKMHVEHIIAKLHVSDRTQAAVRAIELGLIRTKSD